MKGVYLRTKEIKKQISEKLKDKKLSEETKRKMSESGKKKIFTKKHRKNLSISANGRKLSEETKKKISKAHKGMRKPWVSKTQKGNKNALGHRGLKGKENIRYKLDRTTLAKHHERNDSAYQEWRKQVWLRDNFKCRLANKECKGKIIAHHILSWRDYPELRYIINNGITLCHAHHPRKRAEEKRLIPIFMELVSVSSEKI